MQSCCKFGSFRNRSATSPSTFICFLSLFKVFVSPFRYIRPLFGIHFQPLLFHVLTFLPFYRFSYYPNPVQFSFPALPVSSSLHSVPIRSWTSSLWQLLIQPVSSTPLLSLSIFAIHIDKLVATPAILNLSSIIILGLALSDDFRQLYLHRLFIWHRKLTLLLYSILLTNTRPSPRFDPFMRTRPITTITPLPAASRLVCCAHIWCTATANKLLLTLSWFSIATQPQTWF